MSNPVVDHFVIDDDNEDKFWLHGLTPKRVRQVLDRHYTILPNRKERRASHLVIGLDCQGCCIAVPIEPTHDPKLWRPVTAWLCKPSEVALLPKPFR